MQRNLIVLLLGISGMTALFYEIIWIRPLSLVFGTTVYAVSTIIASFIFGLAIGSWIAGKYTSRIQNPLRFFAFIQIGIGFYGILLLPTFSSLPPIYLELYRAVLPNQTLFFFVQIFLSFTIISLPAILMGTTLPLMMKSYAKKLSSVGYDVGKLDAANSVGAVVGTLVVGFLMIPYLGIQTSVIIAAIINLGMGVSILGIKKFVKYRYVVIIVIIAVPLFLLFPTYDVNPLTFPLYQRLNAFTGITVESYQNEINNQKLLHYEESQYGTITVTEYKNKKTMKIAGKNQCGFASHGLEDAENLAKIPTFLYQHNYDVKPETALNVGLGCGATSRWFGEHMNVTTVEIDPAVVKVTEKFSTGPITHNLIIDDGRNWLLKTDEKFDIITGQPSEVYDNHSSLFTKEYFELQRAHLHENGLSAQWIPLYSMTMDDFFIFYNTYHSVFPEVHIYKNRVNSFKSLLLIGSEQPIQPIYNRNYLGSSHEIISRDTELNTDDKTVLETSTALNLYTPNRKVISEEQFYREAFLPTLDSIQKT